ncbi:hypothetical protein K474DRAFT_1172140 [Panus rudis PR-1116 ss-1]|nr:hypothetical protein K474DRAFT_1172140 [Panus rudis PR-1116 ss-1]
MMRGYFCNSVDRPDSPGSASDSQSTSERPRRDGMDALDKSPPQIFKLYLQVRIRIALAGSTVCSSEAPFLKGCYVTVLYILYIYISFYLCSANQIRRCRSLLNIYVGSATRTGRGRGTASLDL